MCSAFHYGYWRKTKLRDTVESGICYFWVLKDIQVPTDVNRCITAIDLCLWSSTDLAKKYGCTYSALSGDGSWPTKQLSCCLPPNSSASPM